MDLIDILTIEIVLIRKNSLLVSGLISRLFSHFAEIKTYIKRSIFFFLCYVMAAAKSKLFQVIHKLVIQSEKHSHL